jgi:hypothetical protein
MTNMFIESEGDIDLSVNHCLDLATTGRTSFVTLAFPSEFMYKVFIESLYNEVITRRVTRININFNVILPPKEDDYGENLSNR